MIYGLDLALQNGSDYIKNRLETSFSWLRERGFKLIVKEEDGSKYNVLLITLRGPNHSGVFQGDDIVYIFKHQLAEILSDAIITQWEKDLIIKQVERNFRRLPRHEQVALTERAYRFMRRCNDNESLNMLLKFGRKNKISHRILDQLHASNALNLDGLINFCLQDYLKEIRFAVDLAYEDFKNEKQYNEFVKLLKYFVENQPPRFVEVNVCLSESEGFLIWDDKGEAIDRKLIDYPDDIIEDLSSLDDLLISILITVAPRRIVFHAVGGLPEGETLKTLRRVFMNRILICQGCDRCLPFIVQDHRDQLT
ncbi:MAG: sporulation protein YtxC [Acidobacteriota bacterium]